MNITIIRIRLFFNPCIEKRLSRNKFSFISNYICHNLEEKKPACFAGIKICLQELNGNQRTLEVELFKIYIQIQ